MLILVAVDPIDFRAGIDGLVGACRRRLEADPFSGGLFVFRNRARTALKMLVYDGQGFWLWQKRLSSGRFAFWPDAAAASQRLDTCELQVLLMAGDPVQTRVGVASPGDVASLLQAWADGSRRAGQLLAIIPG